jgi:hypothetical protein
MCQGQLAQFFESTTRGLDEGMCVYSTEMIKREFSDIPWNKKVLAMLVCVHK